MLPLKGANESRQVSAGFCQTSFLCTCPIQLPPGLFALRQSGDTVFTALLKRLPGIGQVYNRRLHNFPGLFQCLLYFLQLTLVSFNVPQCENELLSCKLCIYFILRLDKLCMTSCIDRLYCKLLDPDTYFTDEIPQTLIVPGRLIELPQDFPLVGLEFTDPGQVLKNQPPVSRHE